MRFVLIFFIVIIILIPCQSFTQSYLRQAEAHWPYWRGPLLTGESPSGNPPVEWGERKNVKWKREIPGRGLSTPIIWDDLLFITTAVPTDKKASEQAIKIQEDSRVGWMRMSNQAATTEFIQQYTVIAIRRATGDIAWKKIVRDDFPHEGRHVDASWASASCITDGKYLIASFGSNGFYCFDLNGQLLWEKDLGDMHTDNAFGEGSTPTIYEDKIVITWDHQDQSFITALDIKTGNQIWKVDRTEPTSWASPIVVDVNGSPQIITAATNKSRGYNLADGSIIWELSGLTDNVIPTPVYGKGIVYLMSGFRSNVLQAVKLDGASGNLENTNAIVWTLDKATPYVPSPLLYQGNLYFLKGNRQSLTCLDAATGAIHYTKVELAELDGVYASPVAANGRVYIAGRNGVTVVLTAGPVFELLATNILDDEIDASPAIAGNELYLRGLKFLYCISR